MPEETMPDEILKAALRRRRECLPIEVLSADMSRGEPDPARRTAELHVAHCFHCRTELDLLREFESGAVRPDEASAVRWIASRLAAKPAPAPEMSRDKWWNRWRTPGFVMSLGGAAAVCLLAIGVFTELPSRRIAGPVPEFGDQVQRARSIEVMHTPGVFDWKAVPGANVYEVTVRGVDDAVVFHNTFTSPALAFPREVAQLVDMGKLLRWEVVAKDSTGNEIARSGLQRVQEQAPR